MVVRETSNSSASSTYVFAYGCEFEQVLPFRLA